MWEFEYGIILLLIVGVAATIWFVKRKKSNSVPVSEETEKNLKNLKKEFDDALNGVSDLVGTMEDPYETCKIVLGEYKETKKAVEETAALLEEVKKQYAQLEKEHLENMQKISHTSHQMRTSLSGLMGFATFLSHTPLNEEQKEYFNYINESTKELLDLINTVPNVDQDIIKRRDSIQKPAKTKINHIPHILVVDDNRINQKLIGKVLEGMDNMVVSYALNGKEAVGLRVENEYDLIFMDVQMPVMDGVEATQKIREWEKEHNCTPVTIVALTANTASSERERYMEAGMDGYTPKPINIDEIKHIVTKVVEK